MNHAVVNAILNGNTKELIEFFGKGFKYQSKKKRFVRRNNYFSLETLTAWSYDWWCYFKVIDGIAVFNDHEYSRTTSKHQSQMKSLLETLGIYPAVYIDTRNSIANYDLDDILTVLDKNQNDLIIQIQTCKRAVSQKRTIIETELRAVENAIDRIQQELNRMVEVALQGETTVMTEREYSEYRLSLSTGDFHMHKAVFLNKKLKIA